MTIYFYSHKPESYKINNWRHVFSQWYNLQFIGGESIYDLTNIINKEDYSKYLLNKPFYCREQWMMACKILIFANDVNRDYNIDLLENGILKTNNPAVIKSIGRKTKGFDNNIWDIWKFKVVVNGNYLQFSQDKGLQAILLGTGKDELVEASPYDNIWGIGYSEYDAKKVDRKLWGSNLLGKAIMEVRDYIIDKEKIQN